MSTARQLQSQLTCERHNPWMQRKRKSCSDKIFNGELDLITSDGGRDWIFSQLELITDLAAGEVVTDINT
jgi:hypothetical protein